MEIVGKGIPAISRPKDSIFSSSAAKPAARSGNCSTNLRSIPEQNDFSPAPRSTRAPTSLRPLSCAAAAARPSATPASIAFMRAALSKLTTATEPRISVATLPTLRARDGHCLDEREAHAVELGRFLLVHRVAGLWNDDQARIGDHAPEKLARLAAARVLVSDHHERPHAQQSQPLLVRVKRLPACLHAAHRVGMTDWRHPGKLLERAAELGRVFLHHPDAVGVAAHLLGEGPHPARFDLLRVRLR